MSAAAEILMQNVLSEADHPLLKQSLGPVAANPAAFARQFYARLFSMVPGVRVLFPPDMSQQEMKLVQTLAMVVSGIDQSDTMIPVLRRLGAAHRGYGTKPMHYRFVGDALVETLAEFSGDAFTPETAAAWNRLFQWVAMHMMAGADAAASEPHRRH